MGQVYSSVSLSYSRVLPTPFVFNMIHMSNIHQVRILESFFFSSSPLSLSTILSVDFA